MAQATVPAAEWVAGMPRARSYGALGLPRLADTPDISIQLLPGNQPPGGVSGLGTTVARPRRRQCDLRRDRPQAARAAVRPMAVA